MLNSIRSPLDGIRSPFGPLRDSLARVIALLFSNNEPGFLTPISPSVCFTDTAGTTQAQVGQAVALALDSSRGLKLGPELVLSSWVGSSTGTGSATITGQSVTIVGTDASNRGRAYRSFTVVAGNTYRVDLAASVISGGFSFSADNTANSGGWAQVGGFSGAPFMLFRAVTSGAAFVTVTTAAVGGNILIDNISVRELPGVHWTQPTLANRPILGRKPKGGRRNILRQTATLATQTRVVTAAQHTLSFRGTGTVTLSGASTSGPLVGTGANDLVSLTFTPTAGNLTLTVSGTVNDAQLELGAVRTAYQLVADAGGFDVTEAGKADCHYLFCGGAADPRWMQTPTITPGTDKVQVFAGVRKLSDAAAGAIAELGPNYTLNSPAFFLAASSGGGANYAWRAAGTASTNTGTSQLSTPFVAPISNVVTGLTALTGVNTDHIFRVDGAQNYVGISGVTGTAFSNQAIFIGARAGTSIPFNGEIYALGVRFGPNLDTATIEKVEQYVASLVAEDTI
jgi:hypothetical protein